MKNLKRNAIVVIVLLFVGTAVYLNWSYNSKEAEVGIIENAEATAESDKISDMNNSEASLYYVNDTSSASVQESGALKKLDAIRLTRQKARDEAKSTLQTLASVEGVSQEEVDLAAAEVTELAKISVLEAEIENKILTKGYSDCVAYISDSGISVTVVPEYESLNASSVAQLTDIITESTDFKATEIKISEVKK